MTGSDNKGNGLSCNTDCHFDEQSEEKSYSKVIHLRSGIIEGARLVFSGTTAFY